MAINVHVPSVISILMILITFAENVKSVSFTFPNFGPYQSTAITFQGDAFASNGSIQLTKITNGVPALNSAGRASYLAPVRLWDAKTGKLASFTTNFSFIVAPNAPGLLGDGITFFIAPFNSNVPTNSSGGFLGLFSADTALNAYKNQIVAVEFDSFGENPWDPAYSHIGIDVNSIASVKTEHWETGSAANWFVASATVDYVAVSKNLSVVVEYPTSYVNGTTSSLSFVIDLRTVLPEYVRVGFSGATGQLVETHKLLSWSFDSTFY